MELIDRAAARASVQPADDDGFYDDVLARDDRMRSTEDECPECMLAWVMLGTVLGTFVAGLWLWLA